MKTYGGPMNIDLRGMFVRCVAGVGLLAATAMIGDGRLAGAAAAGKAESAVADWPEPSRLMALAMIERHGQPDRRSDDILTWFGLYRGRRTVVHRTNSRGDVVEQVVLYRVPAAKAGAVALLDPRIKSVRDAAELSARTESVKTSFLLLNLAHEVASGFRDVAAAQAFRDRQMRLANTGKSSRYRESLIFEAPRPLVLPAGEKAP